MKGLTNLAVEQQALLGRNQSSVRAVEQTEAGVDLQLLQQPTDARLRHVSAIAAADTEPATIVASKASN
jgi:hypothetical protein